MLLWILEISSVIPDHWLLLLDFVYLFMFYKYVWFLCCFVIWKITSVIYTVLDLIILLSVSWVYLMHSNRVRKYLQSFGSHWFCFHISDHVFSRGKYQFTLFVLKRTTIVCEYNQADLFLAPGGTFTSPIGSMYPICVIGVFPPEIPTTLLYPSLSLTRFRPSVPIRSRIHRENGRFMLTLHASYDSTL